MRLFKAFAAAPGRWRGEEASGGGKERRHRRRLHGASRAPLQHQSPRPRRQPPTGAPSPACQLRARSASPASSAPSFPRAACFEIPLPAPPRLARSLRPRRRLLLLLPQSPPLGCPRHRLPHVRGCRQPPEWSPRARKGVAGAQKERKLLARGRGRWMDGPAGGGVTWLEGGGAQRSFQERRQVTCASPRVHLPGSQLEAEGRAI
uniref:uncharacterized protein LOC114592724 n=1 Tax=Podarcis muralis TaxID=64176 RepID=UPI00109FBCDC|nr:uncharacterized protein LOC114592724 [Podarcis muralis]